MKAAVEVARGLWRVEVAPGTVAWTGTLNGVSVTVLTDSLDAVVAMRSINTLSGWVGGRGMRRWVEVPVRGVELVDGAGRRVAHTVTVFWS